MNRRELLKALAAGGVITAAGLWMPGSKLISIPKIIERPFPYGWIVTRETIGDNDYKLISIERAKQLAQSMQMVHDEEAIKF